MKLKLYYFLLVLAICGLIADQFSILPNHTFLWGIAVITSLPILQSVYQVLITGNFSVDLLASVAIIASYAVGEITSVIFINLMVVSAKIFSLFAEQRTADALTKLIKMRPTMARIRSVHGVKEVKIEKVKIGDILLVVNGEKIPVDGNVISGSAAVNQSSLTGESMPVEKNINDSVFAATILESGSLEIQAQKVGSDTSFEKVIKLVSQASSNRSQIDNLGQLFTKIYIIAVLIFSPLLYFYTHNLTLVISILLVVCADDLAVAIPLAYVAGIETAARHGLIVKGANYLERMRYIKHLVLDKTGTITKGIPEVSRVVWLKVRPAKKSWQYLAMVNKYSQHPISKAILLYCQQRCESPDPDDYKIISGQGVQAKYGRDQLFIGNQKLYHNKKITINQSIISQIKKWQNLGFNVTIFAINKKITALICVADSIKPNIKSSIHALYRLGIDSITILTGDNKVVAKRISRQSGIKNYYAGLLPEDKVSHIKQLQRSGRVAMIGDGINDAPSFVNADLSIAMGAIGSDIAIDSANIVLMDDDMAKIPILRKLSTGVFSVVKINIAIWLIANILGVYLVFVGVLNPSGAAAYNFLLDFFPILNSLRILRWRFRISE